MMTWYKKIWCNKNAYIFFHSPFSIGPHVSLTSPAHVLQASKLSKRHCLGFLFRYLDNSHQFLL